MPATEETYRNQTTLHAVFAVSSVAMLLSVVWMIMADHLRPWKEVQREFQKIEEAKLKATEAEKLKDQKARYQKQINELDAKIAAARQNAEANSGELRKVNRTISHLGGRFESLDTRKRFMKAELDSQRSLYDGMIDQGSERSAVVYRNSTIVATEEELLKLSREYEVADRELKAEKAHREDLLGHVDDLVKQKEQLTRDADRVTRTIAQKDAMYGGDVHLYSKPLAFFRSLPGIDLTPPTKIAQISLPELTINYNFKEVPRYDRCTTCHLGIDKLGYDKDAHGKEMPLVYRSHPQLTIGASTLDLKGNPVQAGLYLDANGPHPINSFGCTICHGGQGSGTDFTYSSHTPDDQKEAHTWEKKYDWREMHHWDEPMLPKRFIESSCLKCHHQVTDVPQAEKLQAGYQRIAKYGCTGCHTIGGEGSFGPDLTDERKVGPNLEHVGEKVSKDWLVKWIKNPHAFRPDSRMPRFYGLTNNHSVRDQPKNDAEIHAIAHYLIARTSKAPGFDKEPAKGDPEKGKTLFFQKGCLACHAHKPYTADDVQVADRADMNPGYKPDAKATFAPSEIPVESVRKYAKANFGPNLANIAAKFQSREQGYKWLAHWIKEPEAYHPKTLMPNVQLSEKDAADIASWMISVPGEWPVNVKIAPVDSREVTDGLNDLVRLYIAKGGYTPPGGKPEAVALSEVDDKVKSLSRDEKLMFLGDKTISRLGCFGCHTISGFESAKPIGTPLNGWGLKSPTKLDYGHVAEYLADQPADDAKARDGTDTYYQEKLEEHTRSGFLYQKLHRPRSYDYQKTNEDIKAWDERLRMPQFAWANDPNAVQEVMTFVLGLTGERIAARYLPKTHYGPRQNALAQGAKLLNRYNCAGCHVLEMPKYTVEAGTPLNDAFIGLTTSLRSSYKSRGTDYLKEFYPDLNYDPKLPLEDARIETSLGLTPDDLKGVTIEGMPLGLSENELTVQLWKPVTVRGYTFNVGDNVALDQSKVKTTPAVGGNFAWLYATAEAERTGGNFRDYWNRLPPPLLREGKKVQTPWLTAFLKDPYPIRPAVNLRMPQFHFASAEAAPIDEPSGLANYFAAHDGANFPYQAIPERTQGYLAGRKAEHPDYFQAGWTMVTGKSPCVSCHAIGASRPTGGAAVVNGPDLRQVAPRFRPGYLEEWLAKPTRLVPYTAMPQNVDPHAPPQIPVPKGFEGKPLDMVKAIRDTLLNYVDAVEQQLAGGKSEGTPAPMAPKAGGSE